MKTIRVHDKAVVVVLSKREARALVNRLWDDPPKKRTNPLQQAMYKIEEVVGAAIRLRKEIDLPDAIIFYRSNYQ